MRYLGGGIGHLNQFPSTSDNLNHGDATANDDGDMEVETDDFVAGGEIDDDEEGEGDREVGG